MDRILKITQSQKDIRQIPFPVGDFHNASDIGFDREKRSFHPHVTLGRLRRGALSERLAGLAVVLDRLDFEAEYPVKSVELMQSELSPAGARYAVLASIGLSG